MRWIVVLIMLSACDCGETSPRVPFKLTPAEKTPNQGAKSDATDIGKNPDHFDKPIDHPVIDGLVSPFVAAHAVLPVDLDGDQDRDALAIISSAKEVISLAFVVRESQGFGPVNEVPGFGLAAGCEPTALSLALLSTSKGTMSLEAVCGAEKVRQPRQELVFAMDAKPYLLERLELASPSDASATTLALKLTSEDVDADSHDDVVINAALTASEGSAIVNERIVLLDRGRSLAFDAAGFESALFLRAGTAKGLLRKAPAEAALQAQAVITLHELVCRESALARLSIAGKRGLSCAPSPALARAYATWIATQAASNLVGALDAYVALSQLTTRETKQALADAARAFLTVKPRSDITLSPGPNVTEQSGMSVRLPSARFVTDNLLYLRRDLPVVFDVVQGTEASASVADDRVLDPSGTLAVTAIERRCSGLFLQIERATSGAQLGLATRPVSTPVLLPLEAHCNDTPQTRREDSAGYRVLGWAPQGVLAARGSEVRLVPLSMAGTASGEPRVLDALTPRPAPLPVGRATSDGSRYAWLLPFGVVVLDTSGKAELWRPKGWEDVGPGASDVAISPSGLRIAVISAGRTYLLASTPKPSPTP